MAKKKRAAPTRKVLSMTQLTSGKYPVMPVKPAKKSAKKKPSLYDEMRIELAKAVRRVLRSHGTVLTPPQALDYVDAIATVEEAAETMNSQMEESGLLQDETADAYGKAARQLSKVGIIP